MPRSARRRRRNLAVLGSSGTVGRAVLAHLPCRRERWGKVLLLDAVSPDDDRYVRLRDIDARFVRLKLSPRTAGRFQDLLDEHAIDVVVDLSFADTDFVAGLVFERGTTSYVCTAYCNDSDEPLGQLLGGWLASLRKDPPRRRPHVLFTGMNPGAINVVAALGIERHGVPREIVEFEHDTSRMLRSPRADAVTWAPTQFVGEMAEEAQVGKGRNRYASFGRPSILKKEDMERLLAPVVPRDEYPRGGTVMHEECVTLGLKYDVPAKFVYAVRPETMSHVEAMVRRNGDEDAETLGIMDNVHDLLEGSDTIGVRLEYDDRVVCYVNRVWNSQRKEASATAYQVAVGVHAALHTIEQDELDGGVHFPEDLLETSYPTFVTDNLMFEEHVFRRRGKRLVRVGFHPHVDAGRGQWLPI